MSKDLFVDETLELDLVKEAIGSFNNLLTPQVAKPAQGSLSSTPYKLLVVRQSLFWRTKEQADGAVLCIEAGNDLCAANLARALMETASVQVELCRIVQRAGITIPARELDGKISGVLSSGQKGTQSLSRMAVLGLIDQTDKTIRGYRSAYDELGAYVYPHWGGTLTLFSDHTPAAEATGFDRYANGTSAIRGTTLTAIKLSLHATVHFLKQQMQAMPAFQNVCEAFAQNKAGTSNTVDML